MHYKGLQNGMNMIRYCLYIFTALYKWFFYHVNNGCLYFFLSWRRSNIKYVPMADTKDTKKKKPKYVQLFTCK